MMAHSTVISQRTYKTERSRSQACWCFAAARLDSVNNRRALDGPGPGQEEGRGSRHATGSFDNVTRRFSTSNRDIEGHRSWQLLLLVVVGGGHYNERRNSHEEVRKQREIASGRGALARDRGDTPRGRR
ncbi:hypothetical protein NL676_039754 [Syzygium grande]|nr:hypothetical protein NL676_039754 [Syzygium grande]